MIALVCRSKMWRHQQCKNCNIMDGMAHRAWECPAQKELRTSLKLDGDIGQDLSTTNHPLQHGWAHRAGFELPSEEAHSLHPGHEDFAWDPQLELFTDGISWQPQTSTARAACAVVQVDPESGGLLRFAGFPLPRDYPQTAAAAEHVAIELAAFYSRGEGKKRVQTDCASVCAASKQRWQYSLHKVASGGFWWSCPPSWEFHKVKAHLSLTQAFHQGMDKSIW